VMFLTQFTLRGKKYDLKTSDVVDRMKGIPPEPIKEHYVVIDDNKYPIKQVISSVLDIPRISFTSIDAYNILRKLGFDVN